LAKRFFLLPLFTFLFVVLRGKEERKGEEDAGAKGKALLCLWLWGLASSHWLAYFPPLFVFLIFLVCPFGGVERKGKALLFASSVCPLVGGVLLFPLFLLSFFLLVIARPLAGLRKQDGRASARARGRPCFASPLGSHAHWAPFFANAPTKKGLTS
jgi:fumarate reductase subunit D